MSLQEKAKEALQYFIRRTRQDGTEYWAAEEDAPDWVHDLVSVVHDRGDMLLDDWRHAFLVEALDTLADDGMEMEPDIYSSDLLAWLGSHPSRPSFVDEHIKEYGYGDTLLKTIAAGQVREKEQVLSEVRIYLTDLERI